jgi:hypothetical protein
MKHVLDFIILCFILSTLLLWKAVAACALPWSAKWINGYPKSSARHIVKLICAHARFGRQPAELPCGTQLIVTARGVYQSCPPCWKRLHFPTLFGIVFQTDITTTAPRVCQCLRRRRHECGKSNQAPLKHTTSSTIIQPALDEHVKTGGVVHGCSLLAACEPLLYKT